MGNRVVDMNWGTFPTTKNRTATDMIQGWLEHGACQFPVISRRGRWALDDYWTLHYRIPDLAGLLDKFDGLALQVQPWLDMTIII